MENVPYLIDLLFVLTTLVSLLLFYRATRSLPSIIVLIVWLLVQAVITLSGFYTITEGMPPRFLLAIFPPVLFIVFLFFTSKGRLFLDSLDLARLTLLHVVRIPVEVVLYFLFIYKGIPELMTFEGSNPDILSGLTAPLIYYFGFIRKRISKKVILLWNFVCLGLLINIVTRAVLSLPYSFQQFPFEEPAIAVMHFPYSWLPFCIVPLVLLSHLAAIKQLLSAGEFIPSIDRKM